MFLHLLKRPPRQPYPRRFGKAQTPCAVGAPEYQARYQVDAASRYLICAACLSLVNPHAISASPFVRPPSDQILQTTTAHLTRFDLLESRSPSDQVEFLDQHLSLRASHQGLGHVSNNLLQRMDHEPKMALVLPNIFAVRQLTRSHKTEILHFNAFSLSATPMNSRKRAGRKLDFWLEDRSARPLGGYRTRVI